MRWGVGGNKGLERVVDGVRLLEEVVRSPWLAWMEELVGVEWAYCVW